MPETTPKTPPADATRDDSDALPPLPTGPHPDLLGRTRARRELLRLLSDATFNLPCRDGHRIILSLADAIGHYAETTYFPCNLAAVDGPLADTVVRLGELWAAAGLDAPQGVPIERFFYELCERETIAAGSHSVGVKFLREFVKLYDDRDLGGGGPASRPRSDGRGDIVWVEYDEELGAETLGAGDDAPPEGEWSTPMTLKEMAGRLNLTREKFKTFAKRYGLRNAGNRQQWQIRLDKMDPATRQKLERGRLPKS